MQSEKGQSNTWKENWSKNEPATMKMIDFAHSTFEGFMDDPIVHEGPDSGYITGLDSLITILQSALYNTPWMICLFIFVVVELIVIFRFYLEISQLEITKMF